MFYFCSFLDLKLKIELEDLRFLITQLYTLVFDAENVPTSLRHVIAVLFDRLSKRAKLHYQIRNSGVVLEWTKLFVFIGEYLKKSKRAPSISCISQTNQSILRSLRTSSRFFDEEASLFALRLCDENLFQPALPHLMSKGLVVVHYMISFSKPEVATKLKKIFEWITLYNHHKWYGAWLYPLKKIATFHSRTQADFKPYFRKIFRMLQSLLYDEGASSSAIDSECFDLLRNNPFKYAAKLLILVMDDECIILLKTLLNSNQTQCHPLESSAAVNSSTISHLALLIYHLSYYLHTARCRNPFLTPEVVADLASFLGDFAFLLIFSKDKHKSELAVHAIKHLSALRCTNVLKRLVDEAVDEICAPVFCESRFFALVGALGASARSLLSFKEHPRELERFLCALPALARHIAADHASKTILIFNLLLHVFHYLPICTISTSEIVEENQNYFFAENFIPDFNEISLCLNEFSVVYIQKTISLFESLSEVKKDSISMEGFLCEMCLNTTKIIFHQMSSEVYANAIKTIQIVAFPNKWNFDSSNQLAKLFGAFKGIDDSLFLQTFLTFYAEQLSVPLPSRSISACMFAANCVINMIEGSNKSLLPFASQIHAILRSLLDLNNENKVLKVGWKLFKKLLMNFLFIYSIDISSFGVPENLSNNYLKKFALNVDALQSPDFSQSNLLPNWHVPFEEGVLFAVELTQRHLVPLLIGSAFQSNSVYLGIKAFLKGIACLNFDLSVNSSVANYDRYRISFTKKISSCLLNDLQKIRENCITFLARSFDQNQLPSKNISYENQVERIKCYRDLFLARSFFPDKLNRSARAFKFLKQNFQIKKGAHDYARAIHVYRSDVLLMKRMQTSLINSHMDPLLNLGQFVASVAYDPYEDIRKVGLNVLVGCLAFYPEEQRAIVSALLSILKSSQKLSMYQLIGSFECFLQHQVQYFICSHFEIFDLFLRYALTIDLVEQSVDIFKYLIKSFLENLSYFALPNDSQSLGGLLDFLLQQTANLKRPLFVRVFAAKVFRLVFLKAPVEVSMKYAKIVFSQCFETDTCEIRDVFMRAFYCFYFKLIHSRDRNFPAETRIKTLFNAQTSTFATLNVEQNKGLLPEEALELQNVIEEILEISQIKEKDLNSTPKPFESFIGLLIEEESRKRRRNIAFFKTILQIVPEEAAVFMFFVAFKNLLLSLTLHSHDQNNIHHPCTLKNRITCAHELLAAIFLAFKRNAEFRLNSLTDWTALLADCWMRVSFDATDDICNTIKIIFRRKSLEKTPPAFREFAHFVLGWKHASDATHSLLLAHKVTSLQSSLFQSLPFEITAEFEKKVFENISFFVSVLYVESAARQASIFCLLACKERRDRCLELMLLQSCSEISVKKFFCQFALFFFEDYKFSAGNLHENALLVRIIKQIFGFEDANDDAYRVLLARTKKTLANVEVESCLFMELLGFLLESDVHWADLKVNLLTMQGVFYKSFFYFNDESKQQVLNLLERFSAAKQSSDLKNQLAVFSCEILKYFLAADKIVEYFEHSMREYSRDQRTISERYTFVLQMIAALNVLPYRIEPWMPSLLTHLAQISLKESGAVLSSIQKFYSNFKKSHCESWHEDATLFTAEQLDFISCLNVAPSYFS